MNIPTQIERLDFWKYAYARSSFVDAKMFAEELLASRAPIHASIRKAFTVAIITAYARPFKQRSAIRLPDDIVPAEHREVHDSVIEIRDKVIAHRDIDGPIVEDFGLLSQLHITIRGTELGVNTISPVMLDDKTQQVLRLTETMISMMDIHINIFVQAFLPSVFGSEGTFTINIKDTPEEWLIKLNE